MKPENDRRLAGGVALLWLAAVTVFYYYAHRPFTPLFAARLLFAAWQLFITALIALLAGGLGTRLLPNLAVGPLARLALRAALGLGILGLLVLVVAASVGITPLVAWLLVILLVLILRAHISIWWRDWRPAVQWFNLESAFDRNMFLACGLILLFGLWVALAPPLKFDGLVYHLALPRLYLLDGRVADIPQLIFSGFPQLPHMLYTFSMALGARHAAVVGWMMGVIALLGLVAYLGERFSLRHGGVAAASLLAGFSLASSLAWGYVDWPSILMGWGFLVALDLWWLSHERQYILLAGAFTGLAFGTKYTAALLLIAGLGVLLWRARLSGGQLSRALLQYLAAAFLFALPWLLKNYLATGNPFYPLLFPAGAMDQFRLDAYQSFPVEGDWRDVFLLPVRATFWGLEVALVADAPPYYASLGPLLLGLGALVPLGWGGFMKRQRTLLRVAVITALLGLLAWAVAGRITGHLIHTHMYYTLFPAFAVLAAAGFAGLARLTLPGVRLERIAAALLMLVLWLNALQVGINTFRLAAPQWLLGLRSNQEYLVQNLGSYALAMQAVQDLPEESSALMLWEARGYYCLPNCEPDEIIDRWVYQLALDGDPASALQSWRQAGYTHLLYYRLGADFVAGTDRYTPFDRRALDDMLAELPVVEDFGDPAGPYTLYSLPLAP